MKDTIAIIGAGNMGAAFYKGVREHVSRVRINVCDHNQHKLEELDVEHPYTDPAKAIAEADIVLLAIKPQSAKQLLISLSPSLEDRFIVSVMAGITLASLQKMTRSASIVRAMPNLPAQEGRGLTGWIGSDGVTPGQHVFAKDLFLSVGQEIEVESESLLDSLTPLSGSGPAYFFLLAEMIETKAVSEGFTKAQAVLIARETLIGSARMIEDNPRSFADWRAAVASKGGVTEVALNTLKEKNLESVFSEAIDTAIIRSRSLHS